MPSFDYPHAPNAIYGREDVLQQILTPINARQNTCVMLRAAGGVGKTWLLNAVQQRLAQAGQPAPPIYDFYHSDKFKASQIEADVIAYVRSVVPSADFGDYDGQAALVDRARQSGARARAEAERLRESFIANYNAVAERAYEAGLPLVLLFDTLEQAVNLSDNAEMLLIGEHHTASEGGEYWLREILPRLKHTVFVLAGRLQTLYGQDVLLYQHLAETLPATMQAITIDLPGIPLDGVDAFLKSIREHFVQQGNPTTKQHALSVDLAPAWVALYAAVSDGQPFWLTMLFICAMHAVTIEQLDALYVESADGGILALPAERRDRLRAEVMHRLLANLTEQNADMDDLILALQWMAVARKGMSLAMLRFIASRLRPRPGAAELDAELDMAVDKVFAELQKLLIVKQRFFPFHNLLDNEDKRGELRLFLHDEMFFWLDQHRHDIDQWRPDVGQALIDWYERELAATESGRLAAIELRLAVGSDERAAEQLRATELAHQQRKRQLLLDRLGYYYQTDPARARYEANMRSLSAIIEREYDYDVTLRQENLRSLYRLNTEVPSTIEVECAARWVMRATHGEDWAQVDALLGKLAPFYALRPELPGIHFALLEHAHAYALAKWPDSHATPEQIERLFDNALESAEQARTPGDEVWHDILVAQTHNSRGFWRRRRYLLHAAQEDYRLSLKIALQHANDVMELQAATFNNLAYVYSVQGNAAEARRFARHGLALNQRYGSEYYEGLSNNTLARIEIRAARPERAREHAERALQIFRRFDSVDGQSMCLPVLAEAFRKSAEQLDDDYAQQDMFFEQALFYARGARKVLEDYAIKSAERWCETLQVLGCIHRSYGLALLQRAPHYPGAHTSAKDHFQEAHNALTKALRRAEQKNLPALIQLDLREDLVAVQVIARVFDQRIDEQLRLAEKLADQQYYLQKGVGLRDVPAATRGFWRELGQCQLQRTLASFGAYDYGFYRYEGPTQRSALVRCQDEADLRAAGQHMLMMFAYLLKYARASSMVDLAIGLTLRELRRGRSEAELRMIISGAWRTATQYNLDQSEAYRLVEDLIQQARSDTDLLLDAPIIHNSGWSNT